MCRGWLGVWCGAIFSSGLYVTVCRRADPGVTGPLKFRIAPESACACVKKSAGIAALDSSRCALPCSRNNSQHLVSLSLSLWDLVWVVLCGAALCRRGWRDGRGAWVAPGWAQPGAGPACPLATWE